MSARDQIAVLCYLTVRDCIECDDVADFRKPIANAEDFLQLLLRIDKNKIGIGVVDGVGNLFRGARRIKPYANSTGHDRPNVADGPLGNISHQNANRSTTL